MTGAKYYEVSQRLRLIQWNRPINRINEQIETPKSATAKKPTFHHEEAITPKIVRSIPSINQKA